MKTTELEWTVITWNIQGRKDTDVERLAEVIAADTPDVVVLQEVREPQADRLREILEMNSTWSEKHNAFRPFARGWAEGAAILTPHRLSDIGSARISSARSRRTYRHRIVQWGTVTRDDTSAYRIYNAHLSPHDLADERLTEARRIGEIAAAHVNGPPAIVAGDLNDEGTPELMAALPGFEVLPAPPTNPSDRPVRRLDHVLVPVDADGVSVSVPGGGAEWAALSDHLPVTVRFTLDWVQGGFGS